MNKLLKRLLSGAIAAAMVVGTLVMPAMAADGDPVISVTFDDGGSAYTFQGGATLEDNGHGKSLSVSNEKYAEINDASAINSITGDFTFGILLNPSNDAEWTRAFDIGTGTDSYIFLAPSSSFGTGKPRFVIKSATTKTEQAIQSSKALNVGEWNSVVVYRESGTTKMYVNGELAGTTTEITYNPADAGTTTQNWLGRSQYGSDPYFTGLIDDFVVFNHAADGLPATYKQLAKSYEDVAQAAKKKQLVYDNNCVIAETSFTRGDQEIFALTGMPDDICVSDKTITDTAASFTLSNYEQELDSIAAYVAEYSGTSLVKLTAADIDKENFDGRVSIPYTKVNSADTVQLYVWNDMEPIEEATLPDDNITANVTLKNYTGDEESVVLYAYAVDKTDGNETQIGTPSINLLESLEEKNVTMTIPVGDIPLGTEKLVIRMKSKKFMGNAEYETGDAAALYCLANTPVAAPADSNETTNGAHDPSIVKFGDTYYAYSSHHLIFTSKDLINWKKYDFTNINAKDITPKTYSFISSNYSNTTMNGTYWAPDVIYKEGDAHPYWMYISISCGLGGRNSAISLMKSDNPLFWADDSSDIVDAGVVFATKENSSYITNAIDANIYTDTSDNNKQYFVWGSFWGGIQAVPLTADGLVQGVDYTSNSTILSSCANVKTTIFSQRGGVAGPEGAWMIEHGGYRYAFTSYGWLGSNYNTRIARAPKTTTFATNTGTQLLDANGTVMGTQHTAGSTSMPSGYKLIGSYRLGDGGYTLSGNDSDGYSIPREAGDAHIYYGPGHNSAINVGDESFYVSHTRKDATEIAATLQVRKMLWTSDGWPVVSPVTYAGEKEQALPEEMLTGTYDLASVGHMKMSGSTIKARNFDLPVVSSKVTLGTDMSMKNASGASIGTWTFDGDHTVTLKFTANGDTSKDEFYKTGDTMTLFALYGYDKDEAEPVIALTGTDQNHITQFAKKSAANVYKTTPEAVGETTPITLAKSTGGNPELGFDTNGTAYAGDPAALVDGDTVYMYVGHDTAENEAYKMPEWLCYSSKNMTDWTYEGVVMKATDISWRSNDTSAWASQCVKYGSKYYLYYCTWDKTSSGKQSIGVAVSDSPIGPFTDPLGKPLVSGSFTTPESNSHDDIDPTVLIDTVDGVEHRYLAWGNTRYYVCELNENMTSVKDMDGDGEIVMHKDIKEKKIKSLNGNVYTEAPWLYKRDNKYYLFFATNWREEMAYAMTDNPFTGRYDYIQTIMPPTATSNTNHPAVIDFNNKTYFIYHNGALPHGSGFRRSVCIDELKFDENGYVYPVTETSIGLNGTASVIKTSENKYLGHDAFRNSINDINYPLSVPVKIFSAESEYNTAWEIKPAKAAPAGENADNYVSIQSVDKPGLYISVSDSKVTLAQDADGKQGTNMTFKTVEGLDGQTGSVSFESVSEPGKFLTALDKSLTLSYGNVAEDASFTIDAATTKPNPVISVAPKEAEPQPEADITQDFNSAATGSLIHLAATETPAYTALNGVTLYIGTRSGGADTSQNFSIFSGGVTGNALVLNAGAYQSASRGGRMAIYTPAIPNGYTVTAEMKVKQGSDSSVLRFNDSTTDETATTISGLSTDWQTFKVTITNNDDVYSRTIMLGDNVLATDYVSAFPVLWGTTENKTGQSIYFDDLTIKTTTANGETPVITAAEPVAKFTFDNNLTDAIGNGVGTLTGSTVSAEATVESATYVEGESGKADDKAISFTGAGSYGVALPVKPSGSNYTISFDAKLNAATLYTSYAFMINHDDGNAPKSGDSNAEWVAIDAITHDAPLTNGPVLWSRKVAENSWPIIFCDNSNCLSLNEWHNITVTVTGTTANIYVDKKFIKSGDVAAIIDSTTKLYLGVNAWDTPLTGAIDNFMLFNETLSASQVALIGAE